MKKNVIKMAAAAICVVAAGMGGFNAYNVANQSTADLLLADNVEALSAGDSDEPGDTSSDFDFETAAMIRQCPFTSDISCSYNYNGQTKNVSSRTYIGQRGTYYEP